MLAREGNRRLTPTGFDSSDATTSQDKDLRKAGRASAAKSGAAGPGTGSHGAATDPDLARIIEAWPGLPEHVRAAMLALISSKPNPDT
jgi:hypothetical protein